VFVKVPKIIPLNYPKTKGLTISGLFATLLSISSFLSIPIPITDVPITLQVLFVLLAIMALGPVYGFLACAIYLVLGAVGLPVFAGATGGIPILIGPTGGYLFGFLAATIPAGFSCRKRAQLKHLDFIRLIIAAVIAIAVIYLIGVVWLAIYLHLSFFNAFLLGALPFIPVDALKAVVAISIALQLRWSKGILLPPCVPSNSSNTTTGNPR
jgi:biotin transport system substrate-specific component